MALLVNAFIGTAFCLAIDVPALYGAIGAPAVSMAIGQYSPSGLYAGVLVEVWTGELIKKLRTADAATFLDGLPDYSQYSENDVIHLVDIGADPDVLINNTTYPIAVQELVDGDKVFKLDKFQTKATPVTDDELYALSYDKMASVKERHGKAILESKYTKAIHALAPASNSANTPVIKTSGDAVDGRRRLIRMDIVNLKTKFDDLGVPTSGRRLVLCSEHVYDLLSQDQVFAQQYYNYTSGKISNLFGFEVYEYQNNPYYTAAGNKKNFGVAPGTGERQSSVAFYAPDMFKATGSTKMYFSEAKTDPTMQRNLINFRHYYIVLPKKNRCIGAIISDTAA
jgi:hypothetical protein